VADTNRTIELEAVTEGGAAISNWPSHRRGGPSGGILHCAIAAAAAISVRSGTSSKGLNRVIAPGGVYSNGSGDMLVRAKFCVINGCPVNGDLRGNGCY